MTDHTVDFISSQHKSTKRDYVARVVEFPKAECAKVARQFGRDYWDGERQYGYGGYRYDGRWAPIAQAMVAHYGLKAHHKVLDVGCGKAFLLYELWKAVPGLEAVGIDVSQWGIDRHTQVVAYDDNSGVYAGRLWWMLRWLGHDAVAVLAAG